MNTIKETIKSVFDWIDAEEDFDFRIGKFLFVGFGCFFAGIAGLILTNIAVGGIVDIITVIMKGVQMSIHGGAW